MFRLAVWPETMGNDEYIRRNLHMNGVVGEAQYRPPTMGVFI